MELVDSVVLFYMCACMLLSMATRLILGKKEPLKRIWLLDLFSALWNSRPWVKGDREGRC